jgi:hypothetical protein
MTGQCYQCAAGEHHECYGTSCTCCGPRNAAHQQAVNELEVLIRESRILARARPVDCLSSKSARCHRLFAPMTRGLVDHVSTQALILKALCRLYLIGSR